MVKFEIVFDKILLSIEKILFYFVSALIVIVSFIVCAEIISRNIFSHSFVVIEELTMILLGWIAYFSAAFTVRKRGHVAVDFLYGKFPIKIRKTLYGITTVSILVFMSYIFFASSKYMKMQMKIPLTLSRLPRGLISMGLPLGTILIIFFTMTDLIETFIFKRDASLLTSVEMVAADLKTVVKTKEKKNV